jgi:hypothetical protein
MDMDTEHGHGHEDLNWHYTKTKGVETVMILEIYKKNKHLSLKQTLKNLRLKTGAIYLFKNRHLPLV